MRTISAVLALLSSVLAVRADDEGFRSLFNGKDLTGWTYNGQPLEGKTQTPDGRFLVVDGTIVAAEGKGIKVLNTAVNYDDDFVFRLEFRNVRIRELPRGK